MSIIFEGVDGVGKTTNIQQFMIFNNGYSYIHNWAKPSHKIDILSEATKEIFLLNTNHNILFDRSFLISEYVYAHILKRETPINFTYMQELADLINRKKHTVKLFIFNNYDSLKMKDEDKHLPVEELNSLYYNLLTSQLNINNLIVENIDKR